METDQTPSEQETPATRTPRKPSPFVLGSWCNTDAPNPEFVSEATLPDDVTDLAAARQWFRNSEFATSPGTYEFVRKTPLTITVEPVSGFRVR